MYGRKGRVETRMDWAWFRSVFFAVNDGGFRVVAACLLLAELFISLFIVKRVPYTEIDWSTYMQQVAIYSKGERNYSRIEGDTGPVVYPAGFLVIFQMLSVVTSAGTSIRTAQNIFIFLYLLNLLLVFRLYFKSKEIAPFVLVFLTVTGYRIHSIFMLRLFNDPIAMLLFYIAANFFVSNLWLRGCIFYSLAVSVKMNVLLFSPALFFLLLINCGCSSALWHISVCAIIQLAVALPFLSVDPVAYISRSFDLGRVFLFKWTVNWRFLPESVFLDRRLHAALLLSHIILVSLFAFFMWFRSHGGLLRCIRQLHHGIRTRIGATECLYALFTANLLGMAVARSLHFQFYSWYFHQLPFLLFRNCNLSTVNVKSLLQIGWRTGVLLAVEFAWNTYPSTVLSSTLLHLAHLVILIHLFFERRTVSRPTKSKLF